LSIAVVQYGAGNVRSVVTALNRVGSEGIVTANPSVIMRSDALIFPGVGAAGKTMERIRELGLDKTIKAFIGTGKAFMGICLGMQLMLEHHDENDTTSLGFFQGNVPRFEGGLKIPHMGWNQVHQSREIPLFKGIKDEANFYFVHSYFAAPLDRDAIAGETEYGVRFCSILARDNVFGTQFHPEKSGDDGLKMLQNFLEVSKKC
jgi:imidazole glycerol-phosphate synthase subunit HisH